MTQCVRALAVLAEGLGLTPMGQLTTICNSTVGIHHPLLASTAIAHTQCLDKHVLKYVKKKKLIYTKPHTNAFMRVSSENPKCLRGTGNQLNLSIPRE